MLFMWGLIIAVSALCGYQNPVYFGAGFCIGYIIKALCEKADILLYEVTTEAVNEMRRENDLKEKELKLKEEDADEDR